MATARLEILGQVARVLTHETRNIVGSFTTCLEILRRNAQLAQDDRELVTIMQSGASRLNEIVDQFAAFGHRAPLRFESVDIAEIINGVIQRLLSDQRCSAAIDISARLDPTIGRIYADRTRLATVCWTLCLNAVQAMGDSGRLEIATRRARRAVEILVRDNGPGVAAAIRGEIFAPLFTTKTRATGLGLAIARRIAEEHGGHLQLGRTRDSTTCFIVRLPTRAAELREAGVRR